MINSLVFKSKNSSSTFFTASYNFVDKDIWKIYVYKVKGQHYNNNN